MVSTIGSSADGKTFTIGGFNTTVIQGNSILQNNAQLVAADFPNSTTLYGWNMDATTADAADALYGAGGGGTKIGANDLTVKGASLGAANDVLGNSKYCSFGGTAYLISTDAVFNFTGDFSIGGWFYATDWSPATEGGLISRFGVAGGNNGWMMTNDTDGTLTFKTYSGGGNTSSRTIDINSLTTSAWHHIVITRNSSTHYTNFYVEGNLMSSLYDATDAIQANGNLEIGSFNGGSIFTGRMDEVFIHNATVLTADQVRNIYAKSAKKFAVKDQNSNMIIPFNTFPQINGTGTAVLGVNTLCPAADVAKPYTWVPVIVQDGSVVFIPAWK